MKQAFPAPKLLAYEENESLIGSDFYVMHFCEGQIPTDNPPFAFGSWVTELSDEQRATMWSNGLHALAKIHQIDIEQYDLPNLPRSGADQNPIQHELDKFSAMLDEVRERAEPVMIEAWEYLLANVPTDGARRLCWGDFQSGECYMARSRRPLRLSTGKWPPWATP